MSSGLEASIAGTSTHMLDELSYALPASAQYMKKREELYWTSGANVYAANGIRTMRVNISGQGFLDMSSIVLECDVDNLSAVSGASLKPLVPGLEGFFPVFKGIDFWNDSGRDRGPFMLIRTHLHNVVKRVAEGEDRDERGHGFRTDTACYGLQGSTHARNNRTWNLEKGSA